MSVEIIIELDTRIASLGLSTRACNSLVAGGINTLGDLVSYEKHKLKRFRNMGARSLLEIENLIHKKGLYFGYVKPINNNNKDNMEKPTFEQLPQLVFDLIQEVKELKVF